MVKEIKISEGTEAVSEGKKPGPEIEHIREQAQARLTNQGVEDAKNGHITTVIDVSEECGEAGSPEAEIVGEINDVLPPERIQDLIREIESFKDPEDPYNVCGYAASIATSIFQKLLPGRDVKVCTGVFIAPNSRPIWHFYTTIDYRVFLDFTHEQFDQKGQRVLIDKISSLAKKYDIVHFQRGESKTFHNTLYSYIEERAKTGDKFTGTIPARNAVWNFTRKANGTLQDLENDPTNPSIPYDQEDRVASEKTMAMHRKVSKLLDKWGI